MEALSTQTTERTDAFLQTSRWYSAVTLVERIAASFQREQAASMEDRVISEQAVEKLLRWKMQAPFHKGSFFADRLAMDQITEADLLVLLDEPVEALQLRMAQTPTWLAELAHNIETHTTPGTIAHFFKEARDTPDAYALLQPFYPLLQSGVERFQAAMMALAEQYEELPFNPDTSLSLFLPNLAQQLLPKLSRAVVLELNVARLRGQLQGDTPQERFRYYVQHLGQRENLQAFLAEYCILARQLLETTERWVNCSLECSRRLCSDWKQIREALAPEQEPGMLIEVAGGAGDTHRNGHSVIILTFHSGWRLVYKPRSLRIDNHFQELLTWLNARGNHPAFRTLRIIDKATYGWMEFVSDAECSSEEEVRRFYERQGAYLALLYALDAIDFHAENIIAAGEHPLLIDLEALFHPRVSEESGAGLTRPALEALAHSILRISLLPQRIWSNDEFVGVDMSGLAKTEGQLSPRPVAQWKDMSTDEMKIIREHVRMSGNKNCPRLRGQYVEALAFIQSIITGFTAMYQLLTAYRGEFVTNMLPRFAHDEIRFIARATRTYAVLLTESFHPNMLRDALKRERFFDRLWTAVEYQPYLQRLIAAERADLYRGDIPLFTTYPHSCDVFTSQGECIPAFFPEPALELVERRLYQLSEEDLKQQIWLIHASFASTSTHPAPISNYSFPVHITPMSALRERLSRTACAIGDRLCALALQDNTGADWIGLTFVKEREWSITEAGIDLYSGLPGIILFLSYLGTITGETRYTLCAISALKTLRTTLKQMITASEQLDIGGFTGVGSCIYLFSHLAVLWKDLSLVREAEELVQLLPEWIAKDDKFDIMDGSAGCIASLLSLYAVSPAAPILAAAIQCGNHLLACAQLMLHGIGWKTASQEVPLTGFAHGASGVAWSLLKLADASGEEHFRHAALGALTYERTVFSYEKRNRLGLRSSFQAKQEQFEQTEERAVDMSWSHGVPGIVLARLIAPGYIDDEIVRREIEAALATMQAEGIGYRHKHVGPNHSLAHGDLGNLEVFLMATRTLHSSHLQAARERITAQLLESMSQDGLLTGAPLNVETPGLMIGLAGIGYELLRLSEPDKVPSVLVLAPPVGNQPVEQGAHPQHTSGVIDQAVRLY